MKTQVKAQTQVEVQVQAQVQVEAQARTSRTLRGCKVTVVLFFPCVVLAQILWVGNMWKQKSL